LFIDHDCIFLIVVDGYICKRNGNISNTITVNSSVSGALMLPRA